MQQDHFLKNVHRDNVDDDELTLGELIGFGPLSRVINHNMMSVRDHMVYRDETDEIFIKYDKDGTSPTQIDGGIRWNKDVNIGGNLTINKANGSSGELLTTSDMRVKENVKPLKGSLADVLQMRGYTFSRKDWEQIGVSPHERFVGFIAQDIQRLVPEAVRVASSWPNEEATSGVNCDGDKAASFPGQLSVNYPALVAVLIEAIKELYDHIKSRKMKLY